MTYLTTSTFDGMVPLALQPYAWRIETTEKVRKPLPHNTRRKQAALNRARKRRAR